MGTVMEKKIIGKPYNSTIYLDTGVATICPQKDDSHQWEGGRWIYGQDVLPDQQVIDKDICWYKKKNRIIILVTNTGKQITMAESSFKHLKQRKVDLSKDRIDYCAKLGVMYAMIAQSRDYEDRDLEGVLQNTVNFNKFRGNLRQFSFMSIKINLCDAYRCFVFGDLSKPVNTMKDIPLKLQKRAINQVYFDHAFENAGGIPLIKDIQNICIYGPPKPITPLK